MVHFLALIPDTEKHALSVTIMDIPTLIANGTLAQSVMLLNQVTHSTAAPLTTIPLACRPHSIPPPCSHRMVPENSRPPYCRSCASSPPRSPFLAEDFDYNDIALSNMTGSSIGFYAYF